MYFGLGHSIYCQIHEPFQVNSVSMKLLIEFYCMTLTQYGTMLFAVKYLLPQLH